MSKNVKLDNLLPSKASKGSSHGSPKGKQSKNVNLIEKVPKSSKKSSKQKPAVVPLIKVAETRLVDHEKSDHEKTKQVNVPRLIPKVNSGIFSVYSIRSPNLDRAINDYVLKRDIKNVARDVTDVNMIKNKLKQLRITRGDAPIPFYL